jgi:hypothetical protein
MKKRNIYFIANHKCFDIYIHFSTIRKETLNDEL